jgi:hypothetical protein
MVIEAGARKSGHLPRNIDDPDGQISISFGLVSVDYNVHGSMKLPIK